MVTVTLSVPSVLLDGLVASKLGGDCDDADATLNPTTLWYQDEDGDTFGTARRA